MSTSQNDEHDGYPCSSTEAAIRFLRKTGYDPVLTLRGKMRKVRIKQSMAYREVEREEKK